jgi:glc operon protein GlcG
VNAPAGAVLTVADVSLELAELLISQARAEAQRQGVAIAAAVVDRGGLIVAAARMDGAQICAMPLATDKAFTAVAVGLPTHEWADMTQPSARAWGFNTTLGGRIVVFGGGVPVVYAQRIIGGLGVSGGSPDQDRACAEAAVKAVGVA